MQETMGYIERVTESNYFCKDQLAIVIVNNSLENTAKNYLNKVEYFYKSEKILDYKTYTFYVNKYKVRIVDSNSNNGYAGGNNIGSRICDYLYGDELDIIIFSNNDVYFSDRFNLDNVINIFNNNRDIGIVGTRVLSENGEDQNPRKDMTFITQMILWDINIMLLRGILNKFIWNLDIKAKSSKKTGWVSGSFMFVRNDVFKKVGGFDTKTFLYCEEMILSQKFRIEGYDTYYDFQDAVIHKHKGSNPTKKQREWNHESKKYYYSKYKGISKVKLKFSDLIFKIVEFLYDIKHK
ncbi:glycosyltransferase [Ligilactobacillus salivarius]|uniref:glycosyltransferase n=1 Tax=Ligilactobacillus salivarius TaxID=1624 RepID=UPI003977B347